MYQQIKRDKTRLLWSGVIAFSIWVIGAIVIIISVTLVVFTNNQYKNVYLRMRCPNTWTFNYIKNINIIQIIYIVAISVYSLCMLLCALITFHHRSKIKHIWHLSFKFRAMYPLFMLIGLLCGIVAILLLIKVYLSFQDITASFNNGYVPLQCLVTQEISTITKQIRYLIIIIALIGLMLVLTLLYYCFLPYRYVCNQSLDSIYYQDLNKQRLKEHNKKEKFVEESQEVLLLQSRIKQKQYAQMAIQTQIQKIKTPPPTPVIVSPAPKKLKSIGVGDNLILPVQQPPKIQQKIEIITKPKVPTKSSGVGNHVDYSNRATDCNGLISQSQMSIQMTQQYIQIEQQVAKVKRSQYRTETRLVDPGLLTPRKKQEGSDIMVILQPQQYGYYYLQYEQQADQYQNFQQYFKANKHKRTHETPIQSLQNDRSKYFLSSYKKQNRNETLQSHSKPKQLQLNLTPRNQQKQIYTLNSGRSSHMSSGRKLVNKKRNYQLYELDQS